MCEEGYAAVTSRRVAERAGLKSQLVHYHFGTMDELFLEAYRRNEQRHFSRQVKLLKSDDPTKALWGAVKATEGTEVVAEYVAAANHRKLLSDELQRTWGRFWALHVAMVADQLKGTEKSLPKVTPEVLVFLLKSVGSKLLEEGKHGFTEGHAEIQAFMSALLEQASASTDHREQIRPRRRKSGENRQL
jgi:AcrR family transcriptional regulator